MSVSAVVDELFAPVCFETAQIDEGTDPGSQVIQMVNNLLIKAVQEEASDIHIEPFQDKTQVRFRIDGILHQKFQLPKGILNPLVSRLKVMANLILQSAGCLADGRIELKLSNIDLICGYQLYRQFSGKRLLSGFLIKSRSITTQWKT